MDFVDLTFAPTLKKVPSYDIEVHGVCSINGGPDVVCTAVQVSLDRLCIRSAEPVKFLDTVILNLPQIGILEAIVSNLSDDGFDLKFEQAPRSKLGTYVAWIKSSLERDEAHHEERGFDRLVPIKRLTSLQREDEQSSLVRIVDLSRSGVAFTTSTVLVEGERVHVGALVGRVARLIGGGAAVRFDRLIDENYFNVMIDLDDVASVEREA